MRPSPIAALVAALALPLTAGAQETRKTSTTTTTPTRGDAPTGSTKFSTRQELNAHYEQKFADLDKQRIADLGVLAPKLKEAESESVYAELFNLAVTRDQYEAAEKAAIEFLDKGKGTPQTKSLASFVNIIASSNRGQYEEATKDLDLFLKGTTSADPNAPKVDPNLIFAVGEAFLQRLIKAGQYGAARKVCNTFVADSMEPAVKAHFAGRLARIEMLGKPAPAISGVDPDNKKVNLADYAGKVVLVDFWATWAPPCQAQMPYYSALRSKYGEKGFEVLGVNVDAANQNVKDKALVAPAVRRFLLAMRVSWPTVMNGTGANDFAKSFGVTDIPANFLIDRDGKIIQVELSDIELDKAIDKAVGEERSDGDQRERN